MLMFVGVNFLVTFKNFGHIHSVILTWPSEHSSQKIINFYFENKNGKGKMRALQTKVARRVLPNVLFHLNYAVTPSVQTGIGLE